MSDDGDNQSVFRDNKRKNRGKKRDDAPTDRDRITTRQNLKQFAQLVTDHIRILYSEEVTPVLPRDEQLAPFRPFVDGIAGPNYEEPERVRASLDGLMDGHRKVKRESDDRLAWYRVCCVVFAEFAAGLGAGIDATTAPLPLFGPGKWPDATTSTHLTGVLATATGGIRARERTFNAVTSTFLRALIEPLFEKDDVQPTLLRLISFATDSNVAELERMAQEIAARARREEKVAKGQLGVCREQLALANTTIAKLAEAARQHDGQLAAAGKTIAAHVEAARQHDGQLAAAGKSLAEAMAQASASRGVADAALGSNSVALTAKREAEERVADLQRQLAEASQQHADGEGFDDGGAESARADAAAATEREVADLRRRVGEAEAALVSAKEAAAGAKAAGAAAAAALETEREVHGRAKASLAAEKVISAASKAAERATAASLDTVEREHARLAAEKDSAPGAGAAERAAAAALSEAKRELGVLRGQLEAQAAANALAEGDRAVAGFAVPATDTLAAAVRLFLGINVPN
jgi:hypothetical protein